MKYFQAIAWTLQAIVVAASGRAEESDGNNVAVIGAGLSGLTAAWFLQSKGYNVTVFEKNNRVGGQVYSEVIEGGLQVTELSSGISCTTNTEQGNPSELGAVIAIATAGIDELAEELGVPHTKYTAFPLMALLRAGNSVEADQLALRRINPIRLLRETKRFQQVFIDYPEISSPSLFNHSSDLFVPMDEFARNKGFPRLSQLIKTFMVPFGYGYFSTVPAAYYLNAFKTLRNTTGDTTLDQNVDAYVFPCGYQSLLESIASRIAHVHLGMEISFINRLQTGTVEVFRNDGSTQHFDKIIIASGLSTLPSMMDASEEEIYLFSRIKTIKYLTSYVSGEFVRNNDMADAPAPVSYAFDRNKIEERIDHVNLMITSPSGALAAWQIVDEDTTIEEATDILKKDLRRNAKIKNTVVQRQEMWPNYFPTVSQEDFSDGFHDRVEALQGSRNTYYADPSLSFHMTNTVFEFAKDLVERKFMDVNVD